MKILVINPGATSTKIAVFQDEEQLYKLTIDHSAEELDRFERVIDQRHHQRRLPAVGLRCRVRPRRPVPRHPLRHLRRQ